MKIMIKSLLATLVITLTAFASPALLVETTITQYDSKGGKEILMTPRIIVASGNEATMQVGNLGYTIVPTLHEDGSVELCSTLFEGEGKKSVVLAAPRIKARLEQNARIQIGKLEFMTKISLAK